MASAARSAFGTLLKIHDGVSTYTTISEMTTVTMSGPTVEIIDVTNHDSPSAYREKIPSLIDGGECTFEGNWTSSTTQDQVRTDMVARTLRLFQIVYPQASAETHSFSGYITTFSVGAATVDGKMTCSGTITITGPITVS